MTLEVEQSSCGMQGRGPRLTVFSCCHGYPAVYCQQVNLNSLLVSKKVKAMPGETLYEGTVQPWAGLHTKFLSAN